MSVSTPYTSWEIQTASPFQSPSSTPLHTQINTSTPSTAHSFLARSLGIEDPNIKLQSMALPTTQYSPHQSAPNHLPYPPVVHGITGPPVASTIREPFQSTVSGGFSINGPPIAIQAPPESPLCLNLEKKQYCFGNADCRLKHLLGELVCDSLVAGKSCERRNCRRQHPNEITFEWLQRKVQADLSLDKDKWAEEMVKRRIEFRWHAWAGEYCPHSFKACNMSGCLKQHPNLGTASTHWRSTSKRLASSSSSSSNTTSSASSSEKVPKIDLVDVTSREEEVGLIRSTILCRSARTWTITKLIRISNSKLKDRFDIFMDQSMKSAGSKERLQTDFVCHGTSTANCDAIAQNGFDTKYIRRTALGPGHYFALAPDVSLGYCAGSNTMLICEVIHSLLVFHPAHNVYVVKDDHAILPRYIMYFSVT
jgi:hypothetical protein